MNLFISHFTQIPVRAITYLLCFCLSLLISYPTLIASPIQSDLAKLDELIAMSDFKKGIAFTDKIYLDYLEKGDTMSAYGLLVKKLFCLKEIDSQDAFHVLSKKILSDLSPQKYPVLHRDVMWHECRYLAHKDYKAYVDQLNAIMAFEVEFGSEEKYIDAFLELTSAEYYVGNVGFEKPRKMLKEISHLDMTEYQRFDYHRQLAVTTAFEDEEKADSIYQVAHGLIHSVPLLKTKAGFLREYSQFLGNREKYASSIEIGLKSLELYEQLDGKYNYSRVAQLVYISTCFKRIGQIDIAREYMDRANKICESKDIVRKDAFAIFRADLLIAEGHRDLATSNYLKAIEFLKDFSTMGAVEAYVKLGTNYLALKDFASAKKVENELINYLKKNSKVKDQIYQQYFLYARIAEYQNDQDGVEENLISALNSNLSLLPSYRMELYDKLSDIYKAKGDFEKAYAFTKQYSSLNNSLRSNIRLQSALTMESEYNRAEQNNKIALLDTENQLNAVRLSNQRKFLIFTSAAFLAFLGISFLLFSLFRKLKSQNLIINKSLEEKETLLKEIHHRVKNNLQLVSSLLTLQSRDIIDVKAIEAINEGKSRVRSMALIHQDLYSRDNLTGIGMKRYIENLSQELFSTYQLENQNIELELNIDDIYLDVDTIIPIGLIINELITNALKYAFHDHDSGMLAISFTEKNGCLMLDVQDNGKGINSEGFKKESSFGNKLITTLTEQLDGTIKVDGHEGTHIHLEFKDYKLAS